MVCNLLLHLFIINFIYDINTVRKSSNDELCIDLVDNKNLYVIYF